LDNSVLDRLRLAWLSAVLLILAAPLAAREATPMASDPILEARVMAIAEELRCLVCQNETIAASHADLAVDLRAPRSASSWHKVRPANKSLISW